MALRLQKAQAPSCLDKQMALNEHSEPIARAAVIDSRECRPSKPAADLGLIHSIIVTKSAQEIGFLAPDDRSIDDQNSEERESGRRNAGKIQRDAETHQSHTEIHWIPCEAVDAAGDQSARRLPGLRPRSVGSEHAQGGSDQSEAGKATGHSKQLDRAGCGAAINHQAKGKQTAENQRRGHEYARIVLTHGQTATTVGRNEVLPPVIRGKTPR